LEKCHNQDYFEKALELSIQNGMKVIPVDISDYLCMEIDFVDDLKQINKKI
jgi:choline kinase